MTPITPAMDKYEDLAKRLENAQGGMHAHCQTDSERYKCERGNCACYERHVALLNEAATSLRTLQTERDQDRRDAERYRWLREHGWVDARMKTYTMESGQIIEKQLHIRLMVSPELAQNDKLIDAAIDTAISSNSDPIKER